MKKIICLFTFLSFFIVGCAPNPSPPIPPEKMEAILLDVHLAEAYSSLIKDADSVTDNERNIDTLMAWYQAIWDHHLVDSARYVEALQWYMHHPEALDSVYTKMIPKITEKKDEWSKN